MGLRGAGASRGRKPDLTAAGVAIGLELGPRGVRAVVVDGGGAVIARETRRAASGSPLRAVKAAVQAALKGTGAGPLPVGACAHDADLDAVQRWLPPVAGVVDLNGRLVRAGVSAAVAERWVGAARGAANVAVLVIGDRISAGILIDGRPWVGAHGQAGSAAWFALNPVERQDYRKGGCLDAEVSARGVGRRLAWRVEAGDESSVVQHAGDSDVIAAERVFEGARAGDGVAESVVRETAKYIGMAIANLVLTMDPDMIVLGGSMSRAGDVLLEPVRQECARRLPPALASTFTLVTSPLGEDAPAIGAARLAMP